MTTGTLAPTPFDRWRAQERTSVVVVDDSSAYRGLVTRALLRDGGFDVLGEADGRAGLDLARAHGPHLVLLDVDQAGLDARLDALRDLRWACPKSQVVVLTDLPRSSLYEAALQDGAAGVIRKGSSLGLVVRQLRALLGLV